MSAHPVPLLHGARVVLRAQNAGDLPALFALHADAEVMRYWSCPPFTDLAQAQAMFERNERSVASGDGVPWAIALRADPARLVGTCSLFAIDRAHRRAMLGYALARAHWNRGYAREALRLALAHAFGALGLHRLEADADPRNAASLRLLESVGFAREGLLRERWRVGDEVQDSALYGLLARDHAAAAAAIAPA
jgi:RimJ/RimL family protein N-acetyltransferase